MQTLLIEVTDQLHAKIQKRADEFSVTPEDVVKNILACQFKERKSSNYPPIITAIVQGASDALKQHLESAAKRDKEQRTVSPS
jgi:hypothetical protein